MFTVIALIFFIVLMFVCINIENPTTSEPVNTKVSSPLVKMGRVDTNWKRNTRNALLIKNWHRY